VLEELATWRGRLGSAPKDVPETDPRKIVAKALGYLRNNRSRMQ
jgi:hypothetical protein